MALLRDASGPVERERLLLVADDTAQVSRCLASLVEDGLAETPPGEPDLFALPV